MKYVAIDNQALKLVTDRIYKLAYLVEKLYTEDAQKVQDIWIENTELAQVLHLSLKTLQSYRERGVIGYSIVGRKIYYKRSDIAEFLKSNRISQKQ